MYRKNRTALFITILLNLALCTSANPSQTKTEKEIFDDLCKNIHNSYECAQAIERYQIKRYSKYVTRVGNQLQLILRNGKVKILEDTPKTTYDDVNLKAYSFRDYLRNIGYFLIEVQYYEGGEFLMVNNTSGNQFLVPAIPAISPDKKRFVSVSIGFPYNFNGIQIWKLISDRLVLEWSYEPENYVEFRFIAWLNNNTIKLGKHTEIKDSWVYIIQKLKLTKNGWQLAEE